MTSTNDGKEVKSYQTSGPKGKTYFIELYKSLETRLNEAVTASERTKHLCEAWRRVHSLCVHSASTTHPHLLIWLQKHTARVILQAKWPSPERKDDRLSLKEAINVFIVESNSAAATREGGRTQWEAQLVARGEWFKKVLEHPWKHPVLNCLLNPNGTPPTNDEVLEWLIEERGVTFVIRLHTLVSEKCDDIAMSLTTAVMDRVRGCSAPVSGVVQSDDPKDKPEQMALNFGNRLKEEAGFTVDVWEMLADIELVLLHKLDSLRCIALAKLIPLRTAYQLIERLQSRLDTSPREKKLWKNCKEVAVLISQVVITRCMMVPQCTGDVRSALYCCSRALVRLTTSARLANAAAALGAPAPTAAHLHTLAAAVDAQLAQKNDVGMKPFVCELYVRAITAGMNELERLKLITEKETEARSMEQTLASWFVQLGAVLSSSDRVKCECALTAFSVHPSPQMYERIKAAPVLPSIHIPEAQETSSDANPEFGSWASDSRSQTNFVKTSKTLNMKARRNQANVLSTAILTEGETLGLSPELCQDITVLLSGPRVKTLSWDMDRELLLENCRAYLERTQGGTKAITTELKYLNLNPADFQYLPEEDDDESNIYYGIEKGYEHLVEFQEPEDIWEDAYKKADTSYVGKTETSYSSDEFNFIQPQRKKKTRKPASTTDEDDPLSLVAESKKKEKKERPHSKERSKDMKKITDSLKKKESGDPLELENQQMKEKPKKERKKKAHKQIDSSLANLVGLKVGKSKSTLVHQESDAESQGRSSVPSMNSEGTIFYDGVFSMDDMRSPRSSHGSDSVGLMQMHESIMANHMPRNPFHRPYRPTSASGIRIASPSPSQSPSDRFRNDSPNKISEKTKGSLAKLLKYRRQKALEERRKPSAIIRPQGSTSMNKINISPKGVAIPEIPKSYISKQTETSLHKQTSRNLNQRRLDNAIPSPVIQYASKFTSPEKPSRALYSQYYNNVQADRTTTSNHHFSTTPLADNFLDSVNSISIYDKNAPSHSRYPYDKIPSYSDVSQDSRRPPEVDTSYNNYKDYLHEFSPLDAYSQYLQKRDACMKNMRHINHVSPVVPNKKSEHKSPQSAKQVPQKPDGSLNTFARMSYYKNQQTDIKKSQDVTQHSLPQTVGSKMDGFIMNHLHAQNSVSSFNYANSQASPKNIQAMRGNEKLQGMMSTREREHPLLSNMLQTNLTHANVHQKMVSPAKSGLSDKDQNDLLLLLRQQNQLNKSQNSAVTFKTHNTLNTPVACGSNTITRRADAICDSNVPSSFIPKEESKPNETLNKVSEAKMINVLSTSIIKTADQKPKNPKKSSPRIMKIPTENKPKKGKAKSKERNTIAPKPEPHRNPEEWENVMNAILKQKTPCRGPNALEMTLNKSSFEKAFEDSLRKPSLFFPPMDSSVRSTIISQTESIHEEFVNSSQSTATFTATQTVTKTKKTTYTPLKIPHRPAVPKKASAKKKNSGQTTSKLDAAVDMLIKQQQIKDEAVERLMRNNHIEITKHTSSITVLEIPEVTHKHSNGEKSTKIVQQRHVETSKINVQQNDVKTFKKTVKQNNAHLHKKHVKQVVGETHKKEKQTNAQINQSKYVGLKQDDRFISGIPNSDYDVLEELMDDDLRKEIGELSSDEESYQTQGYTKVTKTGQKPADVAYRAMNDSSFKAPISNAHQQMCKQYEMPQSSAQSSIQPPHGKERVHVKNSPVMSAQSKTVICSNAQNVTSQYVMTQYNQARPCSSASLLRSARTRVDTNMYITVPCPAPVQNVLIIPSELVNDSYPSAHNSMQAVPHVPQNTYITVTNTPSVSMYQTTFLPAVATPLIITSAVVAPVLNNISIAAVQPIPTTRVSENEYCFSSDVLQQPFHLATSQGNIVVDENKLEVKSTSSLLNTTDKDIPQKTETKISADTNEILNAERKVLTEVQEKHDDENLDCKRIIQKANSKDLKTKVDQERLKKKRIAILNRKITNVCGIPTIALGYSPLQHLTNTEKKDDDVTHVKDVVQSNETVLHESSNDIISPATPDSCKKNKNEPTQVRRILLRSSNKLKSKISATTSSKPSLDKKIKQPISTSSKTPSKTRSKNEQNDIEIKNKQIRVTKRVRNKSVTSLKDNKKEETKVLVEVQKKPTVALKCYKKKAKNAFPSKIENPMSKIDLDMEQLHDIETEHLDSTITNKETVDSNKPDPPKISSPTTVVEKIVESLFLDKEEVISLPVQNEDELQQGLPPVNETPKPSEQEELCKQTIQPTEIKSVNITTKSEETNKINDDLLIMGATNSVLVEDKVKEIEKVITQENDEKLKISNIEKEIISKAKQCIQPDQIKTNEVYSLIEVNSPDTDATPEIILPIEFVNIPSPRKVHPLINMTNKEIVQTLDKSTTGAKENSAEMKHSNDINSVCIKHTQEIVNLNKSQEVVVPQSQVTALDDDDDDIEIVGDIPNIPTQEKNVQSNPSLNSIVIEDISGVDHKNPLRKKVRIILGNGKVFKGTVSGTVDVTNLLDDPKIKSLLMSQFGESKKQYSLKLNVSKILNDSHMLPTYNQKTLRPQLPQTVETVSLLSDDEEDDSPKMFETEFGKHKIAPMDGDLFKKHQKKLIVKSFVSVIKLSLDEENDIINRSRTIIKANDDINTQISKECGIIDDTESPLICSKKINDTKIISEIPSKYVQGIFADIENILAPSNVQKQEEPIVLIDDSSNDSIDIKNKSETKEKIDELKNRLLMDLGVDDLPTNDGSDDVQVTWDSEAIDLTDDPMLEPIEHKAPTIVSEHYQSITNQKCFVNLVRCDNIELNQSKGQACVDDEFKNKETSAARVSRSDSLTILEEVPTVNELNKNITVNRENCSSPVIKVYDLLVKKVIIQNTRDITAVRLDCYSEWMTTKRDERLQCVNLKIEQSFVVPQLSTLVLSYVNDEFKNKETTAARISRSDSLTILEDVPTVNELNKNTTVNRENCSSPVMKVDDLLVKKVLIQNTRDITAVRLDCYSEWMTTKRDERLQCVNVKIEQSFVVSQLSTLVLSYVNDEFKNKETTAARISRSDSLTILEDVPTVNELNKNTTVNRENCSSPGMKVDDLLVKKVLIQNTRDTTAVRLDCYSEWMTTKRDERLQCVNVTIEQSFVVPQLRTLVLSYIQKKGLVKVISLKRKAMPSVLPDAKISKLDKPADEPTSNDSSRSPTPDLYATRTSKCFISKEKRIIDDLDTIPDLSDTDVIDMTVSNSNDNKMTLMTTEMQFEENQKAHNKKKTLIKEISDVGNCIVYDDTTLENKVTKSNITMNSLDLSENFTADFTKEHSSSKILNETSAEFSVDLVDENPINLNILKQMEEPILVKSDTVYQDEDKAVFENKLAEAVTDSHDINPYVSKDFNAKLRTKEDAVSETLKETAAELSMNRNSDIPFDFDNQQQIEEPVFMKSNLLPVYKDDDNDTVCDNDYETVLENKVVQSQNKAMTDSHDINPYLSKGFISDTTEDIISEKSKETSTELPMDRIDDMPTDLHTEKQMKESVLMTSDLVQAHKGDDNDTVCQINNETVLENKVAKSQKEAMTYSHDPYLSEGSISEHTKEDSISEILKETSAELSIDDISIDVDIQKLIEESVLMKSDLMETHKKDDKKVTEYQNRLMFDSFGINPNISEDCVAEATKEISNEPSVKLSIKCSDDIPIDLDPEIEEPVLINTDLVEGHIILDNIVTEREKKSMVESLIDSSDLCNPMADPFKEHSLSYMSTTPECRIDNITDDMSIDSNMQQIEELVLIKTGLVQGHIEDVDKIVHVEVVKNMPESNRGDDSDLPIGGFVLPENQENYTIYQSETSLLEHSERLISRDTKLNKNSESIARGSNVIKCFELLAESKDSITAEKENITLDGFGMTNELISLHLEKPLQTTTSGDENITDSMHEPLIDQEITEVNVEDDIQPRNEIVFPKTSSSDDTNTSDETMCKKHSSSHSKSQISNKYDVPEYLNQEIKNTYDSKITKNEITTEHADKVIVLPENENSKHEVQESVMNVPTIKEHHTISKATHYPVTNDEILDALNQMFEEKSDTNQNDALTTTSLGHNEVSTNKDYKNDNNSVLNDLLELNVASIESAKMSKKDHIYKITIEKPNESNIADLPRSTDEIVTVLKKIFGEPEDSSDMREVFVTENVEHVSPSKNFIAPHPTDLVVNASHDYYNDTISVSLQKGLSLMEEPECDIVVDGIVDMLNDEIIEDITLVTLNCNERNATQVQKDNVVDESTVAGILESDLESNVNVQIVRGVHYEDPVIGTRSVFSDIKQVAEVNETISQTKDCKENINQTESNIKEIEDLKVMIPKRTYPYLKNNKVPKRSSRILKRKQDMSDVKTVAKKYRKGRNIDYSKITASSISELAYAKEYKRIIDYCSTIKFSYARPFHIENIDVERMLKTWPVKCSTVEINDPNSAEDLLYRDTENTNAITDPLERTLNEEIVNGENINNYQSIDINEINFNMGFGERSGRVIQKLEAGITKLSAATLSDVKQYQPFSMSEITKASSFACEIDTQKVNLSKFTNLINIKEKVRSVFKKMEVELTKELVQNKKNTASDRQLSKFPFCLTSTEFIEVPRMDSVVNVVQVGQSPVSVAVQNPITCDPRVTHVSDASPQCSDNCTGEDTQSTVETKYTELTTANITLPQEYAQNRQKSPPSHEQKPPETNDAPNKSFSIVKIELLEETSQENQENDIYDTDFSPLPSNNIEYSFEDTSNSLFNTSGNLNNTSKAETSNNVFNTSNNMDTTFTNMFSNATNMDNAYSTNTPLRTETNYTNMDRASASTNMYSTSPNMANSSTVMDNAINMNEASNLDTTTNINISPGNRTYSSIYNPMRSDSNDMNNTATNINGSAMTTNMNSTSIENTIYDYSYENIEDYAGNIENNNNENFTADVDNFDAVENYSADVDDYTSNMENYATNNESYRTGVGKYASSIENYATNIENYSTNVENYSSNAENTNSNNDKQHTNINNTTASTIEQPQDLSMANSSPDLKTCNTFEKSDTCKTNRIGHATNAAGIAAQSVIITSGADELANLITQSAHTTSNNYSKSTPINVMTLQQALAHVLPPPLNQTSTSDNQAPNNPVSQQILHIVQGNNAQTVINKPNGTHLLHIVQNKNNPANNGLSLGDTGLQQGGNHLIHIVNNGNQNNTQFLKRVNLLTNLTNAQGSNEQKMIQLVCKSADGKSIQLNTGHQRSMVLRLHPTTVQAAPKPAEPSNASTSNANKANGQDPLQDIKSRSVYEENYAQFIQNSGPTSSSSSKTPCQAKATSLPKFNQVFGKQSYQENKNEINNELQENSDCPAREGNVHLEQTPEVNVPPLVPRNAPPEATQAQPSPAQQIKQTISPMNIHTTMHGGVIYTRQIPVNIGGRQTINLITVPSTELADDSAQKQLSDNHFASQEGEQSSIIKLVPHHTSNNNVQPEENNTQTSTSNETNHTPQPVLTQMRIKLPMLSKGPHIVPGARLVRPSFFQIQRNVITGTNQPVYQQLVLTTAPPLGQTIRLPTQQGQSPHGPPVLVQTSQHPSPHIPVQQVQHAPSSQHLITPQTHSNSRPAQSHSVPPGLTKSGTAPESELSTLTLEQLREFDMVLEQVKERSVQPTPSTTPSANPCPPADSTDSPALATTSVSESTKQVLYSVENSQPTNVVSFVDRKSTITSATTSFVRSPDSSGIVDAPSSSTQVQITHTVTSKSSTSDAGSAVVTQPKKKKKKKSSSSSSTLAALESPSKTNPLKPQEDEQTTQRILYILAEYKEQVQSSPDKNKPAPRRRNQFPPTISGSNRKRHCSSRGNCRRERMDMSPMHGQSGELGEDLVTLGSEDSSCGTTFSECTDCQEDHSPDSPTKVVRRLTFEETTTQITQTQTSQLPQRNVIVGDRQTITVARTTTATTAKPTTTVLMPANYLLPVSMLKGGQQIAIMTNRGPKILVGAGDNNAGALLFQRLITPGLKPVLTRPGVRHIRLPATALHNLQAFNIQTTPVTQTQPPDSTAPQASMPGPPDLVDMRAMSSPWQNRESQDKSTRGPSPDCTEPWNLPSSSIADDYGYEEIVRTDNMERTVLDALPDRYSPDMDAQRIFDKMFDVDSKKSMYDSSRCSYDIDTSDGDDRPYPQVVQQRKDGRHHRLTHVSTAALRHKYAILEHELRLQKSLSEECEDLGVDSPSASELFPEADLLFGAPSPAHEQTIDKCNTPPLIIQPTIPQPDLDDQIATDQLLAPTPSNDDLDLNLGDVDEIVTVGEDGIATIPTINAEEFARSHPNTTFHTELEDGEIPPFTIAQSIKGRHITFHTNRVPGTVVMAPQTTVISQAAVNTNEHNTVKFIDINNMINSIPCRQPIVQSVLVKDPGTSKPAKFDILKESTSARKSTSKFDGVKSSGKSIPKLSKFDTVETFAPKAKFDSLKDPVTSHRSNSKFDSGSSKSSSKFDSLKEPRLSTTRLSSKFDSLKDSGVSNPRPVSKFDALREPTSSKSYSKFDSLKETTPKPLSKFDSLLTESKLQLSNTSARQVLQTGHGTQVIRRLRYEGRTNTRTNSKFHFEEPRRRASISDEVKLRNDRAIVESMGDNASSPGQPELFWDSARTERQEKRFQFSESEKVTKSPFDELLNDSSAYGPHTRLDSVIKAARPERTYERTSFEGINISGSSDESRPLRTYPPKRLHTQHSQDTERHFTLKTTTTTTRHHEVDRTTKTTHHEVDRTKKTRCLESEGRRRTGRGLVKRGCSCCSGSPSAPPKKRSRPKKPPQESIPTNRTNEPLT